MAKENYTLSPWGTIQDLGKFQGEMWYIPELWELTMISGEDEIIYDNDRPHSVFFVDEEMKQKYELSLDVYVIVLWEDDYGFVNSSHVSEVEYNTWLSDIEKNEAESDI